MEECPRYHTNEIAVLEVEAIEFVAGLLCIHYFFIDDERGAFGVTGYTLTDLAVESQYLLNADSKTISIPHVPDGAELSEEFEEIWRSGVVSRRTISSCGPTDAEGGYMRSRRAQHEESRHTQGS
jgi:hypothetical protein